MIGLTRAVDLHYITSDVWDECEACAISSVTIRIQGTVPEGAFDESFTVNRVAWAGVNNNAYQATGEYVAPGIGTFSIIHAEYESHALLVGLCDNIGTIGATLPTYDFYLDQGGFVGLGLTFSIGKKFTVGGQIYVGTAALFLPIWNGGGSPDADWYCTLAKEGMSPFDSGDIFNTAIDQDLLTLLIGGTVVTGGGKTFTITVA